MCNLYRMEKSLDAVVSLARELGQQLQFPEGAPNLQPRDVRISERAPILRTVNAEAEMVERRWSWPGPTGKPVFNFRSDGRAFAPQARCVALASAFYEFTAPEDPKAKTKQRWRFTWPGHEWFGIAGIWRSDPQAGEAFTLLTAPPGPDVAPYHNRQIVVLSPPDCFRWLRGGEEGELLNPLPAGSLHVKVD
jgi:putative SOS response-associated peptidase YedK